MQLEDKYSKDSKSGYKVPEGYFNALEERVFEKITDKTSDCIPKKAGFKTPKDYFENLDQAILHKVNKEEPKVLYLNTLRKNKTLVLITSIAAVLMLYFGFYTPTVANPSISTEMVENYFAESELDSYELAELLIDTEFIELEDLKVNSSVEASDLETYLMNNADVEAIISQ